MAAPAPASSVLQPHPSIYGMWVWKPEYISDANEQQQMLDFAKRQHFNRLLVQIPWATGSSQSMATVAGDNPPASTAAPVLTLRPELAHLIAAAARDGIAVEALDGTPFMGRKEHWAESLASERALIDFNQSLPAGAKLVGIHWDIEPYTRNDWKTPARQQIMHEYLDLLTQAKQKLVHDAPELSLAVDVPFWYDKVDAPGDTCVLEYNGATKNFHEHIQDIVDYVGIMTYRRSADGPNGVIALAAPDLDYAAKIGKFVCPALETIELDDTPTITFYGHPAAEFLSVENTVSDQLSERSGFGGMLIHFYPGIRAVLEPRLPSTRPTP